MAVARDVDDWGFGEELEPSSAPAPARGAGPTPAPGTGRKAGVALVSTFAAVELVWVAVLLWAVAHIV